MISESWVQRIREYEVERLHTLLPARARILELGAGSGIQACMLSERGHKVSAVDLPKSYPGTRFFEVQDYDGVSIPFPDRVFDVVFSSNVLEHVEDLTGLLREVRRVLKPDGYCIHTMPTPTWSVGNYLSGLADALVVLVQKITNPFGAVTWRRSVGAIWARLKLSRHGEHGNALSEIWLFSATRWRRVFEGNGYDVISMQPIGLYYTGWSLLGARMPIHVRARLASILGSSCFVYVVKPTRVAPAR